MLFTTTNPIDHHTHLIGGLGRGAEPWPLPAIYNAAFAALGLNWHYVPLAVPEGRLREALLGLRALGFAGAEVTESHCCDVDKHLEDLSPAAEATGMINFIQVDEHGRLVGDNTQWRSFLWELHAMVPSLNGLKPLVIGAGPAARGIVYALAREGLPVTIINPDMDQAIDLVRRLRHALDEHSFSVHRWPHDLERVAADANLIVNTAAEGAWPGAGASPWPDDLPFPSTALAFDLAYTPRETRFLWQARAGGARTVSGSQLLVCEAALAFEQWTEHLPPIELMCQIARGTLLETAPGDVPCPQEIFARPDLTSAASSTTIASLLKAPR